MICSILVFQPSDSCLAKQSSSTLIMIAAAVEAPGEAKQRDQRTVGRGDNLGAEFENAALLWIAFDDLHPHARDFELPVLLLSARIESRQGAEAVLGRLHDLFHQIFGEVEIVQADFHQGHDIAGPDRQ